MNQSSSPHPFQMLTYALLFVVLLGYLLRVGKGIIMPILIAIIVMYVLVSIAQWLHRQRGLARLPMLVSQFLALALFVLAMTILWLVFIDTAERLGPRLPHYQANILNLFNHFADRLHWAHHPDWSDLWQKLTNHISLQALITPILQGVGGVAGWLFLVILYTGFLLTERASFPQKMAMALPGARGEAAVLILHDINRAIGEYLTVKTAINLILGAICFAILFIFGVDFALFWAILIALFNYIPYIGSFVGVAFPVVLSVAQFASLPRTLAVLALLVLTQAFIGNVVEPKLIGRKVNMSAVVVMAALAVWSALWGIPGAILAIPLTSMTIIILSHFESTRPLAILLSDDAQAVKPAQLN